MELGKYVPILKCKMGELNALRGLSAKSSKLLTPVLELPPLAWDYSKDEPKESADNLVKALSPKIRNALGDKLSIVDGINLPDDMLTEKGLHPFAHFLMEAEREDLDVIPVVGVGRPEDYLKAVQSISPKTICLRVGKLESARPKTLKTRIDEMLGQLQVKKENTILLLDMGDASEHSVELLSYESQIALNTLPYIDDWSEIVLASGAFPNNLGSVPVGESVLPRTDWMAWLELLSEGEVSREPLFADYAVSNPRWFDMDPRLIHVSANIRYTTEEDWFVVRGRSLRIDGHEQLFELATRLVRNPVYRGREFSEGDRIIDDCAKRNIGPGNATTWRLVGTSHHLEFVTSQLAS